MLQTVRSRISIAIVVSGLVVLAIYFYGSSSAGTPLAVQEAEAGTVSGSATVVTNSTASAGRAVRFGSVVIPTPPPTSTPVPTNQPIRLMPLGDSITAGFQYPSYGGYRILLWQRLVQQAGKNIDFVGSQSSGPATLGDRDNEGHNGWRIGGTGTTTMLANIDDWMTAYKPDVILLHAGTNDLNTGVTGAETTQRLDDLLQRIYTNAPNVKVVLAQIIALNSTYPPTTNNWNAYREAIPTVASKYSAQGRSIQVVDMASTLSYPADFADPLHPNVQGYDKLANAWYPYVLANL